MTSAKPTTAEGTFLRVRREMLGLTIDQACEGTPIRRSKWGDVERGRTRPSGLRGQPGEWHAPGSVVAVMAARLGVTPAELREAGREDAALLLEREGGRGIAPLVPSPDLEAELAAHVEALAAKLPDEAEMLRWLWLPSRAIDGDGRPRPALDRFADVTAWIRDHPAASRETG